ncbi:hypothetical protein [Fundidesulfovibrio soli]|uniref:hypothetical protein n=1 Tax=Fundidesulfovibrio soli TaxID=2922716 RepID=UPI001FAF8DDE|nr:hypothetical protein [Fundidesulfovibrio soli]
MSDNSTKLVLYGALAQAGIVILASVIIPAMINLNSAREQVLRAQSENRQASAKSFIEDYVAMYTAYIKFAKYSIVQAGVIPFEYEGLKDGEAKELKNKFYEMYCNKSSALGLLAAMPHIFADGTEQGAQVASEASKLLSATDRLVNINLGSKDARTELEAAGNEVRSVFQSLIGCMYAAIRSSQEKYRDRWFYM